MPQPTWMSLDMGKHFLSSQEVAEFLGISEYVTLEMLKKNEIPAIKAGREWRIAVSDLEEYINAQRGAVRPD